MKWAGSDERVISNDQKPIVLGKFVGHHGVRGWLRVRSFTRPPEEIFDYRDYLVRAERDSQNWTPISITGYRSSGKAMIAHCEGFDRRETSERLLGHEIAIRRSQLAETDDGQYYWFDLIGLDVFNQQDVFLGRVSDMMETGANDVMIVNLSDNHGSAPKPVDGKGNGRERLIPWTDQVVIEVDLAGRRMLVDWPEDY